MLELAEGVLVLQHVSTILGLICLGEVIQNAVVKVLPTKVCVTSDSEHLKHTIINQQERNIESATAEVITIWWFAATCPSFLTGFLVCTARK